MFSLNTPRVTVDVTINSEHTGIKTLLANFFIGAKLFAKIQRTDAGITKATIQGHPKQFPSSLEHLKWLLTIKYDADIVWGETSTVEEPTRLDSVLIEDTEAELKRNPSSCEFLKQEVDEISFGGSAGNEQFKKMGQTIAQSILTAFGRTTGLATSPKKEHISVKYETQTFDLEISSILSLDALMVVVDGLFEHTVPFKNLYRLESNSTVVVKHISHLREGFLYYVATVNEEKKEDMVVDPKMQEFYEKLKERKRTEAEIKVVVNVFAEQGILFEDLMETGKLEMTDEKLEKYGIKAMGLRTAILSIIYSLKKN